MNEWINREVLIFLIYLFYFILFFLLSSGSLRHVVLKSQPDIEPTPLAVDTLSLNHWIARMSP